MLRSWLCRLMVVLGVLAVPLHAVPASASANVDKPVTVMTRNLYLGADIQRPIEATAGLTGAAAFVALGNANHVTRAIVDRTNFPRRSQLLAEEISSERAVVFWPSHRSGPVDLLPCRLSLHLL